MKIIDFHTHMFPEKIASSALLDLSKKCGVTPCTDGTPASTLEFMRSVGIWRFTVLNIATNEKQMVNVNNFAIALQTQNEFIPFGSVYPKSKSCKAEIDRLYENGVRGIKLHPEYQDFFIGDDDCYKVVEHALKLNMLVTFHAGHDVAYQSRYNAPPSESRKIADCFKSRNIIFAHLGGFAAFSEVMEYLAGSVCMFDTACMKSSFKMQEAKDIITAHGIENVLFASDCPWENPMDTYKFLCEMNFSKDDMEKICHINAERILSVVNFNK